MNLDCPELIADYHKRANAAQAKKLPMKQQQQQQLKLIQQQILIPIQIND